MVHKSGQIGLGAWLFRPLYAECQPQPLGAADKYALWCRALMSRALRTMGILRAAVPKTFVFGTLSHPLSKQGY